MFGADDAAKGGFPTGFGPLSARLTCSRGATIGRLRRREMMRQPSPLAPSRNARRRSHLRRTRSRTRASALIGARLRRVPAMRCASRAGARSSRVRRAAPRSSGRAAAASALGPIAPSRTLRRRVSRLSFRGIGDAEVAKDARAVRADLNAGAFFGRFRNGARKRGLRCLAQPARWLRPSLRCQRQLCDVPWFAAISLRPADARPSFMASSSVGDEAALRIALVRLEA